MTTSARPVLRIRPLPRSRPLPPSPTLGRLPAVRFGAANGTLLLAAAAVTALHVGTGPALALLLVLTAAWASGLGVGSAAVLGAVSWAYDTGFAVNSYGVLTFDGADLLRLLVFVALGAGVAMAAHWR